MNGKKPLDIEKLRLEQALARKEKQKKERENALPYTAPTAHKASMKNVVLKEEDLWARFTEIALPQFEGAIKQASEVRHHFQVGIALPPELMPINQRIIDHFQGLKYRVQWVGPNTLLFTW